MPLPTMKKKLFIPVFIIFFLFILMVSIYVLFMVPLKKQVHSLKSGLRYEERLVNKAQDKVNLIKVPNQNTYTLQQKVPVLPLVDHFLLDLQKAETQSNSVITDMKFADAAKNEDSNNIGIQQQQSLNLQNHFPNGIEKITADLTVESPSYLELESFIQAIEELTRITTVDRISFAGNQELMAGEETLKKLTCELTVSTYYYPSLKDLENQAPQIDAPAPSHKENPLVPFQNEDGSR